MFLHDIFEQTFIERTIEIIIPVSISASAFLSFAVSLVRHNQSYPFAVICTVRFRIYRRYDSLGIITAKFQIMEKYPTKNFHLFLASTMFKLEKSKALENSSDHPSLKSSFKKDEDNSIECDRTKIRLSSPIVKENNVSIRTTLRSAIEDGYKWRNYGKTIIKGNPFPRFYFRCRVSNCPTRKNVEILSHNTSMVRITYSGEHNHLAPRYWKTMLEKIKKESKKVNDFDLNMAPGEASFNSSEVED